MLTIRFQTELGIDTRVIRYETHQDTANKSTTVPNVHHDTSNVKVIVPDVRRNTSNANPIVSGVRSDVVNTPTIVSDIHRDESKSRKGVDGRNQTVSTTHTLPVTQ